MLVEPLKIYCDTNNFIIKIRKWNSNEKDKKITVNVPLLFQLVTETYQDATFC